MQFYENMKEGEGPVELYVADESKPLRTLFGRINHISQEECILDSGSQIVSMSVDVAKRFGLTWDPKIVMNMQCASNTYEKTLGLARNVPFTFGGITVYLQVHIMRNPPYRILLGLPFDSFTTSEVVTQNDGSAMITIKDPNTDRAVTLPTYERGKDPDILNARKQDFCETSMN